MRLAVTSPCLRPDRFVGRALHRTALAALLVGIGLSTPGWSPGSAADAEAPWQETRFWTGCEPGPYHEPPPRDPFLPPHALPDDEPESVSLHVSLARPLHPILGAGFNLEHGLWSCEQFRPLLDPEILEPFRPAIARVDTGMLPAAPPDLSADQLDPVVYEAMLRSPVYADSWAFMRRLNDEGVRVVLGVWGGPAQLTHDGTRLGRLLPRYYDKYVEYVTTLVQFIAREQGVNVWAITIANEPDGGDGNRISTIGFAYIAHQLAERLGSLDVKLYGPDTGSAANAMDYLPAMLDDPVVSGAMAFVGFHEYEATGDVSKVVDYVRSRRPDLPVAVTEYTSFKFGDLDDGQEASNRVGFTLDVLNTAISHYQNGVDAALYWDAVDYLQPGHDAITKWGLLRGPGADFQRRRWYYGMLQVLPYLRPGTFLLDSSQEGGADLRAMPVRTVDGGLAIFLINMGQAPIELTVDVQGLAPVDMPQDLVQVVTDRTHRADYVGRIPLSNGKASVSLPGRSVVTLLSSETAGQ